MNTQPPEQPSFTFHANDRRHVEPERWQLLLDWMIAEGVDPNRCLSIALVNEGVLEAQVFDLDADGNKMVVGRRLATRTETYRVSEPPPFLLSRRAAPRATDDW